MQMSRVRAKIPHAWVLLSILLKQQMPSCNEICITNHYFSVVLATLPPKIIEPPQDIRGKLYERAILNCKATGSPRPQILWYKNENLVGNDNIDQTQLVFEKLELSDRGFYHCEARNVIDEQKLSVTTMNNQVIVTIEGITTISTKA